MSIRRLVGLALLLVVCPFVSTHPVAQAPKPAPQTPQLMLISFTHVRPGMAPKYHRPPGQRSDARAEDWRVAGAPGLRSGVTGTPGEFVFLTPMTSMAMFDEPPPMQKALGPEGAAAPITVVEIVPGKRAEFERHQEGRGVGDVEGAVHGYHVMEGVTARTRAATSPRWAWTPTPQSARGIRSRSRWGRGARRRWKNEAGIVQKIHRFISRYRPELSWSPTGS